MKRRRRSRFFEERRRFERLEAEIVEFDFFNFFLRNRFRFQLNRIAVDVNS